MSGFHKSRRVRSLEREPGRSHPWTSPQLSWKRYPCLSYLFLLSHRKLGLPRHPSETVYRPGSVSQGTQCIEADGKVHLRVSVCSNLTRPSLCIIPSNHMLTSIRVNKESIVDVTGTLVVPKEKIDATTQKDVELQITEFHVVTSSIAPLPIQLEDVSRPAPILAAQVFFHSLFALLIHFNLSSSMNYMLIHPNRRRKSSRSRGN